MSHMDTPSQRPSMLLTQPGMQILDSFVISAASHDEHGQRYEMNDGLRLTCTGDHGDVGHWQKQWPGHVAAPDLRHLCVVAQAHWNEQHLTTTDEMSTDA